jgi:hypothetical protein
MGLPLHNGGGGALDLSFFSMVAFWTFRCSVTSLCCCWVAVALWTFCCLVAAVLWTFC